MSREKERELLLRRIFPTPYPGIKESLPLFSILRELGDQYCSEFNDDGFTSTYEKFDPEQVISTATKRLTDDQLLRYAVKYKDKLSAYANFKGQFYTYDPKSRTLKTSSEWDYIEKRLHSYLHEYGTDGQAVLEAVWDVSIEKRQPYKNYYMVQTAAREAGMKKGWIKCISHLQLIEVVNPDNRHLFIPEELAPLVERVLSK